MTRAPSLRFAPVRSIGALVAALALGVQIVLTDRKLARTHRPGSSDPHP